MSPARGLTAILVVAITAAAAWFVLGDGSAPPTNVSPSAKASADEAPRGATPRTAPDAMDGTVAPEARAETARTIAEDDPSTRANPSESPAESREKVHVRGRVVDESGTPLPGIPVSCVLSFGFGGFSDGPLKEKSHNATTDTNGVFRFSDLPAARGWAITARPSNLTNAHTRVPTDARGDLNLGDLIVKLGGSLSGVVRDDNAQPIAGARVEAYSQRSSSGGSMFPLSDVSTTPDRSTTTDASGVFRLDGIETGLALILASKDGYAHESLRDIAVERGAVSRDLTLSLSRGLSISGLVVDDRGAPAVGARVSVIQTVIDLSTPGASQSFGAEQSATADAGGHFVIDGLKAGPYNVIARHDGFLTAAASDTEAGSDDVRIALKRSGMVYGYVVDSRTEEPIEDFKVKVTRGGMFAISDDDLPDFGNGAKILRGPEAAKRAGVESTAGLFVAVDLPSTSVDVRITADGYSPWKYGPLRVQSGDQARADAELIPERVLTGVVVTPGGAPVADARVNVAKSSPEEFNGGFAVRMRIGDDGDGPKMEEGAEQRHATTNERGEFVVRGVTTGDFRITATHPDWAPSEASRISINDSDPAPITLAVKAGGALEGVTFDADGNILPRATVTLSRRRDPAPGGGLRDRFAGRTLGDMGGRGASPSTMSDGEGAFSLRGVTPGDYFATIKKQSPDRSGMIIELAGMDDGPQQGTPVTIDEGQTAYLDLHLPPTGRIEGRVIANGEGVADAAVRLIDPSAHFPMPMASTMSDATGRFALEDVKPGDYALKVSVPDAALPIERDVKVRPRDTARKEVHLPTGSIRGRVTDADSGDPLPGVIVDVRRPKKESGDGSVPARAVFAVAMVRSDDDAGGVTRMSFGNEEETLVTDTEGYYHARYLEPGPYEVEIRGGGVMKETHDSVQVMEGQERANVDFNAQRGAKITLHVLPAEGKELGFFRAELIPSANPGASETRMEAGTSTTTFDGLAPGLYTVKVSSNDLSGDQTVDLRSAEDRSVTIQLQK